MIVTFNQGRACGSADWQELLQDQNIMIDGVQGAMLDPYGSADRISWVGRMSASAHLLTLLGIG